MTDWKVKIRGIKELLNTDETDEEAKRVGKGIYKALISKQYRRHFEDFDDLDEFDYIENIQHLNYALNLLYDYADANLIWIG